MALRTGGKADRTGGDRVDGSAGPITFATDGVPRVAQFRSWQQRWDPIIEMRHPGDAESGYAGRNTIWDLGPLALSSVVAPPLQVRRHAGQIRCDQIDSWFLACARRGTLRHMASDHASVVESGVPILYSMGEPFESDRSDIHWVTLFFSRDFAPELNAALEAVRNRPLTTALGGLLADFILSLENRLPDLSVAERGRLASVARQMVAACIAPSADRLAEAAPALDQTRRERVRLAVRRHLGSASLTPDRLCRLVGISRSNLYRLFEPEGGVARYIIAQRMRAAYAALADTDNRQPIRVVAESVGFAEAASFSRSFRREFGCTPRDLHHALRVAGRDSEAVGKRQRLQSDLPALLRRL